MVLDSVVRPAVLLVPPAVLLGGPDMTSRSDMDRLIEQHVAAEMAADSAGAVAVYTDDVEHDVVGWPSGPVSGPAAAKDFYDQLIAAVVNEEMAPVRTLYGEEHCVVEHLAR